MCRQVGRAGLPQEVFFRPTAGRRAAFNSTFPQVSGLLRGHIEKRRRAAALRSVRAVLVLRAMSRLSRWGLSVEGRWARWQGRGAAPNPRNGVSNVRKALVLAGIAGALVLTACGKDDNTSSAAGTTPPAPTTAAADPSAFGPYGYAGVKFGDNAAAVKAAGFEVDEPDSPCLGSADLKGPKGSATALISAKDGVYIIQASDPIATPEGIKVGSTLAEAVKAYPQLKSVTGDAPGEGPVTTPIPANPKATYEIYIKNGKVDQLDMRIADCH
jgi:hypothetical protein